jgi:threonine synthase
MIFQGLEAGRGGFPGDWEQAVRIFSKIGKNRAACGAGDEPLSSRVMTQMRYISTRGQMPPLGFSDAVMAGLARDGGLLIPEQILPPDDRFHQWPTMSYRELAYELVVRYADLGQVEVAKLVHDAYDPFRYSEVVQCVPAGPVSVLELFHGPTLAFKDIALQFLGGLFSMLLEKSGGHMNIVAATSGDTGSAAIAGVRGRKNIQIFVMHPKGRVSDMQERQMTSVLDANVHNLAIEGSFDDCQRIMKQLFADLPFKDRHALGAVNSVNWARVLIQMVYYFHAAFRRCMDTGAKSVQFSVPTGNFGDILAGYYAAKMGAPIKRLILATNENDILARFFATGEYSLGKVMPTLSPSMDIQVASNFERYLFDRLGGDAAKLCGLMEQFGREGQLRVEGRDPLFVAGVGTTSATLATIKKYHEQFAYLLDPHTAVGVHVAEQFLDPEAPTICLATAHPAKFGAAILQATGQDLAHHPILDALADLPTRCTTLPADVAAVHDFIAAHAQ